MRSPVRHNKGTEALALVTSAFASAPVPNPDGTTGITLIHDYGQGGLFSGGNAIADSDGQLVGDVIGAEFQNGKSANLAANRLGYFHYTIHAHLYTAVPTSSGNAELPGDDLIVSREVADLLLEANRQGRFLERWAVSILVRPR